MGIGPNVLNGFERQQQENRNRTFDRRESTSEQQDEDMHETEMVSRKELIEKNKAKQKQILAAYYNNSAEPYSEGIVSKIRGLSHLNPEGIAFEALTLLLINFFQFIFQTEYRTMQSEFLQGQGAGIAYEPNEEGILPVIYKLQEDGTLNYEESYEPGTESILAVYANGYIPAPDARQAFYAQLVRLKIDMSGKASLTPEEHQLYSRGAEQGGLREGKEKDNNTYDNQRRFAAVSAQQRAKPAPHHS